MIRHAWATFAGSTGGIGIGRSHRCSAVATRGGSSDVSGSGAPTGRGRLTLFALAAAAFVLLALAPVSQAKILASGFGTEGTHGGEFGVPRGIAISQTGAGGVAAGTAYVVDSQHRIQRFSPSGVFERTWGQNVVGRDERQAVQITGTASGEAQAGKLTITYNGETTPQLSPFANPNTIAAALAALPSIGVGNVSVLSSFGNISGDQSAGTITIRFVGALTGTDVSQVSVDGTGLNGPSPFVSIMTLEDGTGGTFSGFEICTVAANCQDGSIAGITANGGQINNPQGVAVNQANGHVYVTEQGNRRVSEFDSNGNFVRAWGWDVTVTGKTGNVSTNAFEICSALADCKTAGTSGADGGRLGTAVGYPVTDAANNVWVPESTNRRIQQFDPSGNFIAAYGYNVDKLGGGGALEKCVSTAVGACQAGTVGSLPGQFANGSPTKIAFDSAGNLYAIDAGNNRVQKFDPTFTSVVNFGSSTFATFSSTAPEQVTATQNGTHLAFVVNNNVSTPERQIIEVDLSANVSDTSLVGYGIDNVNGLAANDTTGTLYATTNSSKSPRKVLIFSPTPVPDPVISMNPVTTKTGTTATFSAGVDPKGGWVECQFEYSTDQATWTSVAAPACGSLDPSGGTQPVSQNATGLIANTHYFVRLSVSRPLTAGTTRTSNVQAFDTDLVAPTVSKVGVIDIGDTSARFLGTIDPRHSATEYVFEYGTTPALGSSTAPVAIGDGTTPQIVSQPVQGLISGTTYYVKLVATNGAGPTESATQTFTTRVDPLPPPDNRAYEQVSPVHKNFGDVDSALYAAGAVAPDGEAAGFCTSATFGEDPPPFANLLCVPYVSTRSPGGWKTKGVFPAVCTGNPSSNAWLSQDLHQAVFSRTTSDDMCSLPPLVPDEPAGPNLYGTDLGSDERTYSLLTPEPSGENAYEGASDDQSHVVYSSQGQQTLGAPAGNFLKLYEWDNGMLRLVSKDQTGAPITGKPSVTPDDAVNGVSADGSRIFFQSPKPTGIGSCSPSCEVYLRENGAVTRWVSEQECTSACSNGGADDIFEWATPSGDKALFRSSGSLTDADTQSGVDLYLYTGGPDPSAESNLTLLSKDEHPADGRSAGVKGVIGIDDEATTVYFAAAGQLVAGAPVELGAKIYRWQWNDGSPTLDYLGTVGLGKTDNFTWAADWADDRPRVEHVTPDGKYLMLDTAVDLDPVVDQDSDRDIYRWSEQDGWRCLSCQFPGSPSAGRSTIDGTHRYESTGAIAGLGAQNLELFTMISDDGQRVFFTSPDALVSDDVNGNLQDVYEWHDGRISLISSGRDTVHQILIGSSDSGRDVFFVSREKLVGWDTDTNSDVYDARIGGGFPEPPPTGAACEGEACRGQGTSAPPASGAGTAAFQGPGNQALKARRCPKGKRKVLRKGKTRCIPRHRKARAHRRAGK